MSLPASVIALANAEYGWRAEALCRDTDPELFFPIGTTGAALVQIEQARAVCRQCPVQADCLDFALTTNQDSGIWGGTSEEERRVLRREFVARQKAVAVCAHSGASARPSSGGVSRPEHVRSRAARAGLNRRISVRRASSPIARPVGGLRSLRSGDDRDGSVTGRE